MSSVREIFLIGGQSLYEEALTDQLSQCKLIIGTRIKQEFEADVFMPEFEKNFEPLYIS